MKPEWQTRRIGEVCSLRTGGTPSKAKPEYFGGGIPWLVSGDINQGEIFDCEGRITEAGMKASNAKLLPVNSVMIALNGQGKTRGAVALLRTPATCNQSLVSIYPNEPDKLMPEFLYANLHGRYQELRQMTGDSGNDRRGLNMSLIKGIEIPVPPFPEQLRIVSLLDEVSEAIATARANTDQNLRNASEVFRSYLESAITRRGGSWPVTTLGAEVDLLAGYAFKSAGYTMAAESVRLLRGDNIVQGSLRWDDAKWWPASDVAGYQRYQLREGDVVLAMDRPWVKAGLKHAMISRSDLPSLLVQRTARIRAGSRIDNRFLMYLIGSTGFASHLLDNQTGSGVPHVSGQQIASFTFYRPPLVEQRVIAARLDGVRAETHRLASHYDRKLVALRDLKQSLLHQAFAGAL